MNTLVYQGLRNISIDWQFTTRILNGVSDRGFLV
jgi:hypothetical protein